MISKFFENPEPLPGMELRAELPTFDPVESDSRFTPSYIERVFGSQMAEHYVKALGKLSVPPKDLDTVQTLSEVEGFATFLFELVPVKEGTEGVVVCSDDDGYIVEVLDEDGSTRCLFSATASILKVTERHRFHPNRDL